MRGSAVLIWAGLWSEQTSLLVRGLSNRTKKKTLLDYKNGYIAEVLFSMARERR